MTNATPAAHPTSAGSRWNARLTGLGSGFARFFRATPFSLGLAATLIVSALLTGTLFGPASLDVQMSWAAGVETTIVHGQWWTPLSALVIAWDPVQLAGSVLAALLLLGAAERLMGSIRAAAVFFGAGALAILLGVAIESAGATIGELWAQTVVLDLTLDPNVGILAALLTASAYSRPLWRRRIRTLSFATLLMFVFYNGDTTDVHRLIAATFGLGLGAALTRAYRRRAKWQTSSYQETRTLIAVVIAVSAIGPLISVLSTNAIGLLSYLGDVLSSAAPQYDEVIARCARSFADGCDREIAIASLYGTGSVVLNFVPLLLLVAAAIGLHSGRRFAWILAVVMKLGLAIIGGFSFSVAVELDGDGTDVWEVLVWGAAAFVVPVVLVVVLIVKRRYFQLQAPAAAVRAFGWTVGVAFIGLVLLELSVGWITRAAFLPDPIGFLDLMTDIPRRFIPGLFLGSIGSPYYPTSALTVVVFEWVGPLFWAMVLVAVARVFRATSVVSRTGDTARLRELLHAGGGGTMSFMATWPGNDYWFAADGRSAVAYRVIDGIAITMSDPIAPDGDGATTIREFAAFCDANSWAPVFYSAHERYLPAFADLGWHVMSVGEETLMHPPTFELAGKPWQKVRQALNRGVKEGLTTLWTTWDELPLSMVNEINSISEQWVAEKELPEMGFTLGAMEELKDPEVALMLAIGADGRMQAITSWLPSYRDGSVVGWTIDFMRRADDSMNGVMEFLIASAALHMRETGVEVLSLSGAPLATKPLEPGQEAAPSTAMTRLMEFLGRTLEPAYGFSSLFRFKAKFNPSYETVYMSYSDPLALPAIGIAIGKAYLPDVSPKEAMALARTMAR